MDFQKSKTPDDIARLLGQLRNYIYRKKVYVLVYFTDLRFTGTMSTSGGNGLSRDSHYQYQRLIQKYISHPMLK
jgi:hypothetical protein